MSDIYNGMADEIRFGDDTEWWKDGGREKVAEALRRLIEEFRVPPDEAKELAEEIFWAAMEECGQ